MKFKFDSKKAVFVSLLVFLVIAGSAFAAEDNAQGQPSIAGEFLDSFVCIFTQCGWPAIVIFILPPIAIYIWKKVFSWG